MDSSVLFCPMLQGNKRVWFCGLQQRAAYGHTCLCWFIIITKQSNSSSTAQVLHSPGSPQALPHEAVVLSIALHFTLSDPVNSIFSIYSLSFCCQASKKKLLCAKPNFVHKHSIRSIKSILVLFLPSVLPHFVPAQTNN